MHLLHPNFSKVTKKTEELSNKILSYSQIARSIKIVLRLFFTYYNFIIHKMKHRFSSASLKYSVGIPIEYQGIL
jgi:hypothetical protein